MTEIDLLFVNRKGIFVIESKNYSGSIIGDEDEKEWLQVFNEYTEHEFYNPIYQNSGHISALNIYLNKIGIRKFHSYIVFGDNCKFADVLTYSENVKIIKRK